MPYRIPPAFHHRVWGSHDTQPWFEPREFSTGEVWFQTDPPLPLLTKFLFTTERLSVQVHPDDRQARELGLGNGKTEMWHILRAEPGASIALGFSRPVTGDEARQASLDGSILDLLKWVPVRAGETYFVPAGTVHALGGGLAVCEIQQNSDTTYRLYDYGRGRELHLDEGLSVSRLASWNPPPALPESAPPWACCAACEYFVTEVAQLSAAYEHPAFSSDFVLLVVLEGNGAIGGQPYRGGECWLARRGEASFLIEPASSTRLLRSFPPPALIS